MTEPVLRAPNRGAAGPAEPLGPTGEASGGRSTPGWAYGVLGVLVVTSAVLTVWRTGSSLELYYAAAVRSMTSSWHNLAFAAFDPRGTISLDKLPGAFWPQALSVRLLGLHPSSLAAPQVVEGVPALPVARTGR